MNTLFNDEIEMYESNDDHLVQVLTIVAIIIGIALIVWTPDVEAIGTWVFNIIH